MTKFNKRGTRPQAQSPVKSTTQVGTTSEGHPGYGRDPKSELFLLGATNFVGTDTFYEQAKARDSRFVNLVHQVVIEDPVWTLRLVRWLRREANMRSAALVAGLEGAKAVLNTAPGVMFMGKVPGLDLNGQGWARNLAKAGIRRPDEPGEAMAYWTSKYGRNVPMPVKRAIADKAKELYTEWTLLKYDTAAHGFRFADVVELTHPDPVNSSRLNQSDLFRYAIERRHNRATEVDEMNLGMVQANLHLRIMAATDPRVLLSQESLRKAGMTWEDTLSLAGNKLPKKDLWEALIPTMGYMALLRNLRNFDQAGVSDQVAGQVEKKLSDPEQVARSRQLPMRFLSAYLNAPSLRWAWPLEQALNHCLVNVPVLSGRTLILVDTSGSMHNLFTARTDLQRWDVASMFGITFGLRAANATVASFSRTSRTFPLVQGSSVLSQWKQWQDMGFNLDSGTDTVSALRQHYSGHDRVIIVTDELASGGYDAFGRYRRYNSALDPGHYMAEVNSVVPASVPLHVINVAGYEKGMVPSGSDNRHVYGGLNDSMFKTIPTVESGVSGHWPWETPGV